MANIKQVRVWDEAHKLVGKLAELIATEKGLKDVTFTDAVSIAIKEAVDVRLNKPMTIAEYAASGKGVGSR